MLNELNKHTVGMGYHHSQMMGPNGMVMSSTMAMGGVGAGGRVTRFCDQIWENLPRI